jgi:polar amino acid transport system substrate-binding protein
MAMIYRVNAGAIPHDSWIQDADFGGRRIIGEVCHFVDFLTWMNGSSPVSVYASAMKTAGNLNDTLVVSLAYENGSIGTIAYLANGDKGVPKEEVEIYSGGCTGIIHDFKSASVHVRGKKTEKKLISQDKGQKEEVKAFVDAVVQGGRAPIPFAEICSTSKVTFSILESLRSDQSVRLDRGSIPFEADQ